MSKTAPIKPFNGKPMTNYNKRLDEKWMEHKRMLGRKTALKNYWKQRGDNNKTINQFEQNLLKALEEK